jgi:hypothetical protein
MLSQVIVSRDSSHSEQRDVCIAPRAQADAICPDLMTPAGQ